jgi:F0F1-type ATP synthase membrane subunit b/b'
MIELLTVRAFFSSIIDFWNKLPSSIKVLLFIGLAFISGFIWGTHKTTQKYEARIEQSINEAKRVDKEANQTAFNNMEAEKERWRKQSLTMENKLSEYDTQYSEMKDKCVSDQDFVKRNKEIDELLFKKEGKSR